MSSQGIIGMIPVDISVLLGDIGALLLSFVFRKHFIYLHNFLFLSFLIFNDM